MKSRDVTGRNQIYIELKTINIENHKHRISITYKIAKKNMCFIELPQVNDVLLLDKFTQIHMHVFDERLIVNECFCKTILQSQCAGFRPAG